MQKQRKSFRDWRKSKGISARFVAKDLGITEQALYNKESGKTEFTFEQGKKLMQLYNIGIDDIEVAD